MVVIEVGDFGTGKTTLLKQKFLISKMQKRAYALVKKDLNIPCENNFKTFLDDVVNLTNTICVVDEASTAIPREQPDATKREFDRKLLTWFVNARKYNNVIVLVFHALEEVPKWLIKYCDYFLRFKTNDLLQYQMQRFRSFPNLYQSLIDIPTMPNFVYDEIKLR